MVLIRCFFLPRVLSAFLLMTLLGGQMIVPNAVLAAKKDKADDGAAAAAAAAAKQEAEAQKALDPLNQQISALMMKMQSRTLFSPADAGKLSAVRFKLFDVISKYPGQPAIAGSAYQVGLLLTDREEYENAYELFSYVSESFPQNPYGLKAKTKIQQLERKLGANYFPKELSQTLVAPKTEESEKPAADAKKPEKK